MKICDVIDSVNKLYPNVYEGNLIRWCYELSCRIRSTIKRTYDSFDFQIEEGQTNIVLPNEILFEDIDTVFADGKQLKKTDFRDAGLLPQASEAGVFDRFTVPKTSRHIRIVARTRPAPYNNYRTEFKNPVFTEDSITVENPEDIFFKPMKAVDIGHTRYIEGAEMSAAGNVIFFIPGDELIIEGSSCNENNKEVVLVDKVDNTLSFPEGSFTPTEDEKITIKRKLNELTEVPAPWDEAYIYFLLSKIHFHNGAYEAYNMNIMECEKRLEEFAKYHKETNAYVNKTFYNYY